MSADSTSPQKSSTGVVVIKGSRRPDGTYRKDIRMKAGYINQEEVEKYESPALQRARVARESRTVVGLGRSSILDAANKNVASLQPQLSKKQAKKQRERANKKKKKQAEAAQKAKQEKAKSAVEDLATQVAEFSLDPQDRRSSSSSPPPQKPSSNSQANGAALSADPEELKKSLRKLKKKLRQIEGLEAKQPSDRTKDQEAKIASKPELLAEIAGVETALA